MPTHPYIPAANTIEVEVQMQLFGQQIENTFYYQYSEGIDPATFPAVAAAMEEAYIVNLAPYQSHDLIYRGIKITDLTTQIGATYEDNITGSVGSDTSASMPGGMALCVKRVSAFRGRSARGRVFIPGIPEHFVTGNTVTTAYGDNVRTALQNGHTAMENIVDGPLLTEVVVSRMSGGVWRTSALLFTVQSYVLTNYDLDSQRRRLSGRGQ